jgi:hypothetical protein
LREAVVVAGATVGEEAVVAPYVDERADLGGVGGGLDEVVEGGGTAECVPWMKSVVNKERIERKREWNYKWHRNRRSMALQIPRGDSRPCDSRA